MVRWQQILFVDRLYFVFHSNYIILKQTWYCSAIDILLETVFDLFYRN